MTIHKISPEVEIAIEELKVLFSSHKIDIEPLEDGGARIIIHDIEISEKYSPTATWIGFVIGFQYPRADIYPHHIDASVKKADGNPLVGPFSATTWNDIQCIQVSRKSNKLDPNIDTAATKLVKIIEWLKNL